MPKAKKKRQVMDWEDWYLLAVRYREEHGDLLIPEGYVCPTGQRLGRWIERQRAKYNRVPTMRGHIEGWQIDYLNQIGMVWKLENRRKWEVWLQLLDRYAEEHGNIDVPHDYSISGCGLGDWLVKQRLRYASGELEAEEIADLESRGVNWNLRTKPRSWEDWFADAETYYRENASLRVRPNYRTPEGNRLGCWIYRQRDIYMGRKKGLHLSENQIRRLNGIGMIWEPLAERSDDWERMFEWVREYQRSFQKLPLWPRDMKAPDGRSPYGWIREQRRQLADRKLSPDRVSRLAELGITPAKRREAEASAQNTDRQ